MFADEIQMSDDVANPYNADGKKITFYDALNNLKSLPTLDIYVTSLFSEVYLKDIVERKHIQREDVLSSILELRCSSIGSLTNLTRVADTINTKQKCAGENIVTLNTVKSYMNHLSNAFLFTECKRWDVKGWKASSMS